MNEKIKNIFKQTPFIVTMVLVIGILFIPLPELCYEILFGIECAFALFIFIFTFTKLKHYMPRFVLYFSLLSLAIAIGITRLDLNSYTTNTSVRITDLFVKIVGEKNYIIGMAITVCCLVVEIILIETGSTRVIDLVNKKNIKQSDQTITDDDSSAEKKQMDYYATLDGVSKFLKGQNKALCFILLVNIVGGIIIQYSVNHQPIIELETWNFVIRNFIADNFIFYVPLVIVSAAFGIGATREIENK